jgi:polar amino acid transport system substrate-binding protein
MTPGDDRRAGGRRAPPGAAHTARRDGTNRDRTNHDKPNRDSPNHDSTNRDGARLCQGIALLLLGCLWFAPAAHAEPALDRIARTGTLLAGTRDDAPPFAFRDAQGNLAGLSVDLIEQVRSALSARAGRPVVTRFVPITTQTRMSVIEDGAADLACETATVTWAREQQVDFTLPIFRDGTRILTYRDTIERVRDLQRPRIGVIQGSVTGRIVRDKLPDAVLRPFPGMPAALAAMEAGEVDGIANIGIVLRGLIPTASRRQGLVIVPRGDALGYETIACMVPQNDSAWRDFVNGVLRDLFRGIDAYRGGYFDIHQRWFGRDAAIAYPIDETTARFFTTMLIWLD